MTKRRVLGITGIRSEYYLQRPIFQAILDHEALELALVVTGAHLSPLHRYSAREVEADGFPIAARIESLLYSDRNAGRIKGAAIQLQALAHVVDALRPDWLLVPGDREEAFTLAACGAYLDIPTAHYAAGDRVVGNVDDMVRHAVSRLAHLLLTTNEEARQRLIRAGEQEWRVHTVGHTGLDRLRATPPLAAEGIAAAVGVERLADAYLIVIQHPLSSEIPDAGRQMRETLAAVAALGIQTFVGYPNSDPGSQAMLDAMQEFEGVPIIHVYRTLPDVVFVNLLRGAAALVGNSSLGIMEAPFLKLPVINVGRRQTGRLHAENVFFVPHDRYRIAAQVREILTNPGVRARVQACGNPYGDGHAAARVADLLATVPLNRTLLDKDLGY
jgi:GDP/UDP-N,N'-diacetylbacillosamine 2-epimerase (hydrolysing)